MNRGFDLTRDVETLETRSNEILSDRKADDIIQNFLCTFDAIEEKFKLISSLDKERQANIINDIYRSQIVFAMSSLDFYVHEIVRYGILSIFKGERERTLSYETFAVNLRCVEQALKNLESVDWLDEWITLKHKASTFMDPSKIQGAFSLITKKNVFDLVAKQFTLQGSNFNKDSLKAKILEIYKRRNSISHQSDRNEQTGELNNIEEDFVRDAIHIIKQFVIYSHNIIVADI
ncbi:HEPN domain-containing protein [Paraclostridium sordellii]|uniref:HEPN domain-containing protein n=1 Tax=Paraclostridium sordellii TaxID=1505 RepID=UPI0030CC974A